MKTPASILENFEKSGDGIDYGSVSLTLFVKQGKSRYVITREESFVPSNDESVSSVPVDENENNNN